MTDPTSVYNRFVEDVGDLQGMVAFSIFERQRQEWLAVESRSPEDIEKYFGTVTPTTIQTFRGQADNMLSELSQAAVFESADSFRQEGANSQIVKTVKAQQNWLTNIFVNIFSSIVFTFIIYLLGIIHFGSWGKESERPLSTPSAASTPASPEKSLKQ